MIRGILGLLLSIAFSVSLFGYAAALGHMELAGYMGLAVLDALTVALIILLTVGPLE